VNELSEADQALCVAYIDGLLPEERRIEFELRLAGDPELARRVQALLSTDAFVRRMSGAAANTASPHRRAWAWTLSLAVAAAILIAFAVHLTRTPAPMRVLVAIAPGYESALDYIDSVDSLRGLRPPGVGTLRGETPEPNVDAASFLQRARASELSLARAAETRAGFFVVTVELDQRSRVDVIAFTNAGERLDLRHGSDVPALDPGRHVLPGERFRAVGQTLEYARGFLVPIGCGALDVVVAVRAAHSASASLAGRTSSELLAECERVGAAVTRLRVDEP
jgi:hypothetical protein